jgi:hydrogenase maturation protease
VNGMAKPEGWGDAAQGPPRKPIDVLILGLGNVLLGDDGLGAAALVRLERDWRIPSGVRLADGGTLGLSLLDLLAESERVILVDAVRTDDPPGTLVRLDGEEVVDAVRDRLSSHQVGVADLLGAARLIDRYPTTLALLGLVPEAIELAVVRSPAVDGSLDRLVQAIVCELQGLGYEMARETDASGRHRPVHDLARHFGM